MLKEVEKLLKWWKVSCSLSYTILFIALGLIIASLGPAITTLEEQTGSTESQAGWLFVARGSGYMIAGLLGGKLVDKLQHFKYLSSHTLMFILCICIFSFILTIQHITILYLLLVCTFIRYLPE